ncbi:hypothetical protein CCR85_13275 [Rhodothalassium salexigens]|uniref:hypothetical protein n=1 Tax=Rhodothalassium salexigens TaxID=1086 RepID=UPI001912D4C5|nr:hypothetical protein [Rhodothalassium salexigens]MBK5912458.1 hypothetical protein [Rhodothalassium salexigens]MBK5921110.1 hypothetical protein [Rhodothalassium salexigens]
MTPRPDILLMVDLRRSTALSRDAATALVRAVEPALATLNDSMAETLRVPLALSYGDEIAGLFADPAAAYEALARLRGVLRDHAGFRYVVAAGRAGARSADIRQVGGPVFKAASRAMARLKTRDAPCVWQVGDGLEARTLTSLAALVEAALADLTDYQFAVYERLARGDSQKDVAEALGKFPQSVSDAAHRGKLALLIDAEATLRARLATLAQSKVIDYDESMELD